MRFRPLASALEKMDLTFVEVIRIGFAEIETRV